MQLSMYTYVSKGTHDASRPLRLYLYPMLSAAGHTRFLWIHKAFLHFHPPDSQPRNQLRLLPDERKLIHDAVHDAGLNELEESLALSP